MGQRGDTMGFSTFRAAFNWVSLMVLVQACAPGFSNSVDQAKTITSQVAPLLNDGTSVTIPNEPPRQLPQAKACSDGSTRGAARQAVNRLTAYELEASLSLVLPSTKTAMAGNWTTLFNSIPEASDMSNVKNFDPYFSEAQLGAWIELADQIGAATRVADLDSCLSVASPAQTCLRQAASKWLPKVWRRPVAAMELDEIMARLSGLAKADAVTKLVSLALVSPKFMFRVESSDDVRGVRVRIDPYMVASRISYALTGAGPDSELMAAAANDQLQTTAQVEVQAKRLLATAAARKKFEFFVANWLNFKKLSNASADYVRVSGNLNASELSASATTREVLDYVNHIVWKENGTMRDLLSRPIALARSASLASVYGSTANASNAAELTAYPAPNHPGLALRAAFLISGSQFASPIRRGVFVLQRLLCSDLPGPSAEVLSMRNDAAASIDPLRRPNFENVKLATSSQSCTGCHSLINPMGFALENFDALGRPQTAQAYLDLNTGATLATHALPPAGKITIESGVSGAYGTGQDLAQALAASGRVKSCMNRELFRSFERRVETELDSCAMNESLGLLEQDRPILEGLVKSVANDDIFWRGGN